MSFKRYSKSKSISLNPIVLISILTIITALFFLVYNINNHKNEQNEKNFNKITKSSEFSNLKNFFVSKINSPYAEIKYIIKNNDSIELILKKFNIQDDDIKKISVKLKQRKQTNIYSGRELTLIFKKQSNGANTLINLLYPINNTSSIEVRKNKEDFFVRENTLQLYKKEVVVKSIIKNNLYSSAISAGIEPNIIVEFARIFGFEVDFQRDIRKGDWFEIYYEKFYSSHFRIFLILYICSFQLLCIHFYILAFHQDKVKKSLVYQVYCRLYTTSF